MSKGQRTEGGRYQGEWLTRFPPDVQPEEAGTFTDLEIGFPGEGDAAGVNRWQGRFMNRAYSNHGISPARQRPNLAS